MKAAPKNESVKVAIRVRPLNKREIEMNSPVCTQTNENAIAIKKAKDAKQFIFDYVFGIEAKQYQVYETCGYTIVQNALEGFNGTIFAYGQTGAGKTFTMVGDYKDPTWKGIIPRGFDHVITAIETTQNRKFVVRASFIEIYNEEIRDLLEKKADSKKELKQSPQKGVFIKDLKTIPVRSVEELFKLLDYGNTNRSVAATQMNATSSRSHALFTVHIESLEGQDKVRASKLNFVDLAGSQRQGKTGATGDTLKEGAKINLSLTALGNVINALVDGKKGGHIPYRDSKLTRLLQDSLGGNTKTLMIASVSPAEDNYDETISTLRYAARARNIKNTPKVNQDPKDALIRQYLNEIENLKKQLGGGASDTSEELMAELERAKEKEKELTEKEEEILAMKLKMKEMEEIIMQKNKESPELVEKTKKRKLERKKIMKNEEINSNKVHELEVQQEKDLQEAAEQTGKDVNYWKSLAKRLRRKLKDALQDKKDMNAQFEDERERLSNSIRIFENDLSFYSQIASKFLSFEELETLKAASTLDYEKRQYTLPPFLMRDEKLALPKTLKRHEVEDLWKEKRKGVKLELLCKESNKEEKSNQLNVPSSINKLPSTLNKFTAKESNESMISPLLKNRRLLRSINPQEEKYQEKKYKLERTNFMMRDRSESESKRSPSSSFRVSSKTKLESIPTKEKKEESQEQRPLSKGKQKLEPLRRNK